MAKLQEFRAYRPRAGKEKEIASPPYDVISSNEAREAAQGNPNSFLHVVKPEIDLDPQTDLYDRAVYEKGRENFQRLIREGLLIRESRPAFYIYSQVMGNHEQKGVVAGVSVAEYENNLIKKHEFTRREKEDDRTRHVETVNANTGPVFLTYRSVSRIDETVDRIMERKPVYQFEADDGIQHAVWVVDAPEDIRNLKELFAEVPALYVADGHHRTASAARVGKKRRQSDPAPTGEKVYDYFLAVLFPHNQLKILDYNRVVFDLNGLSTDEFLKRVGEKFDLVPSAQRKPERPLDFGMFLDGKWYMLTAHPDIVPTDDPVRSLDVAVLQDSLLNPILGIQDPRTDKRIDFIGGIRGMEALEQRVSEGAAVAFSLYPTSIHQLLAVADANRVMPPKSTWFEPKLRSGLIVRSLEDI